MFSEGKPNEWQVFARKLRLAPAVFNKRLWTRLVKFLKVRCVVFAQHSWNERWRHCVVEQETKTSNTSQNNYESMIQFLTLLDLDIFSIGMGCDLIIFCEKRNFRHICYKHQLLQ